MTSHELAKNLLDYPDLEIGAAFSEINGWVNGVKRITTATSPDKTIIVLDLYEDTLTQIEMNIDR